MIIGYKENYNSRQLFDEMKTRKVDSLTDIQRAARFFLLGPVHIKENMI